MGCGYISDNMDDYLRRNSIAGPGANSLAYEIYFRASENGLVGTRELSRMTDAFEKFLKEKTGEDSDLQNDIMAGIEQLCEEYEKTAFFAGLKTGICLMADL